MWTSLSDSWKASLLLALLLVIFIDRPLRTDEYYAPNGVLQGSAAFAVDSQGRLRDNDIIHDPVSQMLPFVKFNRDELAAGRLPLWNPYNGSGAPHLANIQSAVFSPFSIPYYLLPWKWALIVSPFAKLFLAGLFTFLFLRVHRLSWTAGTAGAVLYTFGGYNVLWLAWHNSSVGFVLPAALYFVERVLRAEEAVIRRRQMVYLALVLACGVLVGQPEPFAFCALQIAAYSLFRLFVQRPGPLRPRLAALLLAAALGAGVAAVQWIPFFEYLFESEVYGSRDRGHEVFAMDPALAPMLALPDLLGNPSTKYHDLVIAVDKSYNTINGLYLGPAGLLFALLGVALGGRSRRLEPFHRFWILSSALWLLYIFDAFGLAQSLAPVPLLGWLPASRAQLVPLFSLVCLAALAVDALLLEVQKPRARRAAAILLFALGCTLVLWLGAQEVLERARQVPGHQIDTALASERVEAHLQRQLLGLGAAGLLAALLGRGDWKPRATRFLAVALVLLFFAGTGLQMRRFNPSIDGDYFYPHTEVLRQVLDVVGDEQALWMDGAVVPPNVNLWYRFPIPGNYDAMSVLHYGRLYRQATRSVPTFPQPKIQDLRPLQVLGIRYVVTTLVRPFDGSANRLERVHQIPLGAGAAVFVFRVPGVPEPYRWVDRVEYGKSDEEIRRRLLNPRFSLAETLLLVEPGETPDSAAGSVSASEVSPSRPLPTLVESEPGRLVFRVDVQAPSWLFVQQTYFPGWRATVDGVEAPIVRTNAAFSAVPVPAGSREVTLRYEPVSFRLGAGLALLAGLGLLVLWLAPGRRLEPTSRGLRTS